jgi:hypothetical protein
MTRSATRLLVAAAGRASAAPADKATLEERRKDAIARCEAQRGVDCRTEEGLRVWLLQERSRAEAVEDGSISIRQRVDRLEPAQK